LPSQRLVRIAVRRLNIRCGWCNNTAPLRLSWICKNSRSATRSLRQVHHIQVCPDRHYRQKSNIIEQHNNWRFPNIIKIRPLRDLDDEDFLTNHKVGFTISVRVLETGHNASLAVDLTTMSPAVAVQALAKLLADRQKLRRQHCSLQAIVGCLRSIGSQRA
jgi:hypothetical protein